MQQLQVILNCLNRFCGCSRQRVNFQKLQLFFLGNMDRQLANNLSAFLVFIIQII